MNLRDCFLWDTLSNDNIPINNYDLQTWCATEVDQDGIFQGNPYNFEKPKWGFCGPDCPAHEETLTWSTDTTVKMTLTYDNTILLIGLMLYGYLLACILTCGLVIVLVPAIGKTTAQMLFHYNYL